MKLLTKGWTKAGIQLTCEILRFSSWSLSGPAGRWGSEMSLPEGARVFLAYDVPHPILYHGRYILASCPCGRGYHLVLTPDYDTFPDQVSLENEDLISVRIAGPQGFPQGWMSGNIYRGMPSDDDIMQYKRDAAHAAAAPVLPPGGSGWRSCSACGGPRGTSSWCGSSSGFLNRRNGGPSGGKVRRRATRKLRGSHRCPAVWGHHLCWGSQGLPPSGHQMHLSAAPRGGEHRRAPRSQNPVRGAEKGSVEGPKVSDKVQQRRLGVWSFCRAQCESKERGHSGREVDGKDFRSWRTSWKFFKGLGLEIFSGHGRFSKAIRKKMAHLFCAEVDICHGSPFDLSSHHIQQENFRLLQTHQVKYVWLGTPCNSWSRARRWDGRGPGPLRDDGSFLMGLPNLSHADQRKVQLGNNMRFSAKIFVFVWLWIFLSSLRTLTLLESGKPLLFFTFLGVATLHVSRQIFVKMETPGRNELELNLQGRSPRVGIHQLLRLLRRTHGLVHPNVHGPERASSRRRPLQMVLLPTTETCVGVQGLALTLHHKLGQAMIILRERMIAVIWDMWPRSTRWSLGLPLPIVQGEVFLFAFGHRQSRLPSAGPSAESTCWFSSLVS